MVNENNEYRRLLRERYGTKEGDRVYKYYIENVVNKLVRRLPK